MKTEIRKVTVEQEVYIADDGTEFEDEDDCRSYEFELIEQSLEMYDHTFEKCYNFDECFYARLNTPEDVRKFIELCGWNDITKKGVRKPGVYMYGDRDDTWINISEIISALDKEKDNG